MVLIPVSFDGKGKSFSLRKERKYAAKIVWAERIRLVQSSQAHGFPIENNVC
ncbi:MAG: hypothetical protein GYA22_07050 [Bacteroidales bacterium]|nr:hypothetical protein [Bacteroidales bacterium]